MRDSDFTPNAYAITAAGRLMPGQVVRVEEDGYCDLLSPSGAIYTFAADRVMSVEDAEQVLRTERTKRVLESYAWTVESTRSRLVVRCVNPQHPVRSNYVLVQSKGGRMRCNCPAALDNPATACKHEAAWKARQVAVAPAAGPAPKTVAQEVAPEDW